MQNTKTANGIWGKRFGRWTVIGEAAVIENGKRKWLCKCDCGTERYVLERSLLYGGSESCGCLRKERASQAISPDLTGKQFGELTVLQRIESDGKGRAVRWLCQCSCGNAYEVQGTLLTTGRRTHCADAGYRKLCGSPGGHGSLVHCKQRSPGHAGMQYFRPSLLRLPVPPSHLLAFYLKIPDKKGQDLRQNQGPLPSINIFVKPELNLWLPQASSSGFCCIIERIYCILLQTYYSHNSNKPLLHFKLQDFCVIERIFIPITGGFCPSDSTCANPAHQIRYNVRKDI